MVAADKNGRVLKVGDVIETPSGRRARVTRIYGRHIDVVYLGVESASMPAALCSWTRPSASDER